jgi:hypothetical protein
MLSRRKHLDGMCATCHGGYVYSSMRTFMKDCPDLSNARILDAERPLSNAMSFALGWLAAEIGA